MSIFGDLHLAAPVHREAIDCLAVYGVALGTGSSEGGLFRPLEPVTRGAAAALVARAVEATGRPLPPPASSFSDTAGHPHADAVGRLAALGVVRGRQDGRYLPDARLTRGQAASLLLRTVASVRGVDVASLQREAAPFPDVTGSVHRASVGGAHALGLVRGVDARTFHPDVALTRAEAATLLTRWMGSEAPPTVACTNGVDGFTVWHPADWETNLAVLPRCSVLDPDPVELPPASEVPLGLAIAIRELPVPIAAALEPGPEATVVPGTERTFWTYSGKVRQELVGTGEGLVERGVRSTRFLVDRGDRTLVATTYDVPGNDYRAARGVLTRAVLSLDLSASGLPPYLRESWASRQDGNGRLGLVAVRTSYHTEFERVVLEFGGDGRVGWRVAEWRDRPLFQGSGRPVFPGDGVGLSLAVTQQASPPEAPVPPYPGPPRVPGVGFRVGEVAIGSVVEGALDVHVGVAAPVPYRVFRLADPERLVVDVTGDP